MKKILLVIALIVASFAYAQSQSMPSSMQNSGHVYGKITDADGKPVEGASVLLLHQEMDAATKKLKMILVTGVTTQSNGDFNFTSVPVMGKLQLRISNSGFKSFQQDVSFAMPKMQQGGAQQGNSGTSLYQQRPCHLIKTSATLSWKQIQKLWLVLLSLEAHLL